MAESKVTLVQKSEQQQQKKVAPKKVRARPQKQQQQQKRQQKSVTKDENSNVSQTLELSPSNRENKVSPSSCKFSSNGVSQSPFAPINGERVRRSRKPSKEPVAVTPKSTPATKKRKSPTATSESAAKRRKRIQKSEPEPSFIPTELQNWIPIGKPWAEMVSIGSSPTKKAVCCFPAVKHKTENITFNILDVISVAAGDSEDGDNIGKIDRIFFDKKLGICANVLWYYKYNQCVLKDDNRAKVERRYNFDSRELIASKHTDTVSFDSIQSHAFVLTFNEYCRYIAENKYDRLPSLFQYRCKEVLPRGDEKYPRRRFLPHEDTPQDLVFFCRKYYSIDRKGIFSAAPNPTPKNRKHRRPVNRLFPIFYQQSGDNENLNNNNSP